MDHDRVEVQYGKIARYCLLGQPITAQDLVHLACSQSMHYEKVYCKRNSPYKGASLLRGVW